MREYSEVLLRPPKKWIEESRAKGLDLVLEIDVQGAAQVKRSCRIRGDFHFAAFACRIGAPAPQPGQDSTKECAAPGESAGRDRSVRQVLRYCVVE